MFGLETILLNLMVLAFKAVVAGFLIYAIGSILLANLDAWIQQ